MVNLKFNAMKIAEIEDSKNAPLMTMIDDLKISTLALFIEKGGNISREKAYEKVDEYLATGKETQDLMLDILEVVQRDGFLSKIVDIQTLREQINVKKNEIKKTMFKK